MLCYVIGKNGTGKTTLTSIIAYNLFLKNYQTCILDLTGGGQEYFFRFGACDFFALGDGGVDIPKKLLVTLQDINNSMHQEPYMCINKLPLWPGLKICLTNDSSTQERVILAKEFLEIYKHIFDVIFVEMKPPMQLLSKQGLGKQDRVMVVCADAKEDWLSADDRLTDIYSQSPHQVKIVLNKQERQTAGMMVATQFIEKNKMGVDFILESAKDVLANATVMEMCKQQRNSLFLKQLVNLIYNF